MSNPECGSVDLAVVGSLNLDVSIPVQELPLPGETVLGGDALWTPGGKGANQAVAAARLGRAVAMVGCVGTDSAGRQLVDALVADSIDVSAVLELEGVPTGLAAIAVSAAGENSIVVSPGANARLTPGHVVDTLERLRPRAVLAQFEIPAVAIAAIGRRGPLFVLNPAPGRRMSSDELASVDVVVPNRGELAALVEGQPATSNDDLIDQVRSLGVDRVVVTLGRDGALVFDGRSPTPIAWVPALVVDVVDTTAAGDSFCAGLVDALLDDADLRAAAVWATRVAAVTVGRRGAQVSLPTRAEVDAG